MKIVKLQAENIKRLTAIEINPQGNLIQVTGKNGQGKTSVLDSIWWCLAGASNIQNAPIRRGETSARIRLDLGEIVVTRTFAKAAPEAEDTTSSITVQSSTGAKFSSPQTLLDKLLGELSFDPLAFARMTPREQYEELRRFVPGVDFDALDKANEKDFDERTAVNRKAKEARIYADKIEAPLNAPEARIDDRPLISALSEASAHNSEIAKRKERREQLAKQAEQYRDHAKLCEADAVETLRIAKEQAEQILRDAEKAAAKRHEQGAESVKAAIEIDERLSSAPELPMPKDVAAIQARIDEARASNALYDTVAKKDELLAVAAAEEAKADALTEAIRQREAEKVAAIASAKLPVEGLGFGKGFITLGGIPFDQASDAEQLRVSISIAMAINPKLRVIRVRDGSLLDTESMELLGKMADAADYQVWVERVDSSGKVGFVLEDGHLKQEGK